MVLEGAWYTQPVGIGWEELLVDGHVERVATQGSGGLLDRLGELADPRDRRGVRHSFVSLLAIAVAAGLLIRLAIRSRAQLQPA